MSQPGKKECEVPQPGELDPELSEFWVGNPFRIFQQNNLSSFERNRAYINVEGKGFLEFSHLSGADTDSDGRAVLALDIFEPGKMDLVVRQVGGDPLAIYRNEFPTQNYLKISLDGVKSNSFGLGSKLIARVGDRKIIREMYPINSYQTQQPAWCHFGLGKAEKVDKLEVLWPSGIRQEFKNVEANQHLLIVEEIDEIRKFAKSTPARQSKPTE